MGEIAACAPHYDLRDGADNLFLKIGTTRNHPAPA